jgi:hypothetical protein
VFDKKQTKTLVYSFLAVLTTYYINNNLGFGPFVANGIVGVLAASLMASEFAGPAYTASFVGMSSTAIIPNLLWASVAGLIVGLIILFTVPIYNGIGGKGGTTAALSTLLTKGLLSFFS